MTASDVINFYTKLEEQGIKVWIDGGWAVDALLGEQTRSHQDLDLAVERTDLFLLKEYLVGLGFKKIQREEEKMWDLVLEDESGKEIEVHAFDLDLSGNVIPEEYWNGYSVNSLNGKGIIENQEVRCVSLDQIIKTHNKNKRNLKDTDLLDMKLLSARFGVIFTD